MGHVERPSSASASLSLITFTCLSNKDVKSGKHWVGLNSEAQTHLSVWLCSSLEVILISLRMSPFSDTSSLPVSVPAISRSSDTHAWHRRLRFSTFAVLVCFKTPSERRRSLKTPLPLTHSCVLLCGLKLTWGEASACREHSRVNTEGAG